MHQSTTLYSYPITYSDETIHATPDSTMAKGGQQQPQAVREPPENPAHIYRRFHHHRKQSPGRHDREEPPEGDAPGRLVTSAATKPKPPTTLLGRFRSSSPVASPTSSDSSSRDARSERTLLTRTGSSHSLTKAPTREADKKSPQLTAKKRHSFRGDGGFISQLLRSGQQRQREQPIVLQQKKHQQKAPGELNNNKCAAPVTPLNGPMVSENKGDSENAEHYTAAAAAGSLASSPYSNPGRFHGSLSQPGGPFKDSQYFSPQQQQQQQLGHSPNDAHNTRTLDFMDQSRTTYSSDSASEHISRSSLFASASDRQYYSDDMTEHLSSMGPGSRGDDMMGGDEGDLSMDDEIEIMADDELEEESERMRVANRLLSAIPMYEPINLSRVTTTEPQPLATRPDLPDISSLAPMTSLADAFGTVQSSANAQSPLNNRELRLAIENQLLVEQHRFLIRDLGHARSAISALKQVVQAKEDRADHYEMAAIEMQQKMAIMESILTPEQRQQLGSLPFSFDLGRGSEFAQAVQLFQRQTVDDPDGAMSPLPKQQQQQQQQTPGSGTMSLGLPSEQQQQQPQQSDQSPLLAVQPPGALIAPQRLDSGTGLTAGADKDTKRVARPLSGLQTKYTFNDRPVHQLPRVFSGDYSAADMDAIETSAELFASVVSASSADSQTVEEIIASKFALEQQQQQKQQEEHQQQQQQPARRLPPAPAVPAGSPLLTSDDCADAPPTKTKSSKSKPKSKKSSEPKRRSRFFSALRLTGFHSGSETEEVPKVPDVGARRRSLSLGDTQRPAIVNVAVPSPRASGGRPSEKRAGARSSSLITSCPIQHTPAPSSDHRRSARRPPSVDSVSSAGSAGFYPSNLGLSTGGTPSGQRVSSVASSQTSAIINSGAQTDKPQSSGRRFSRRLSFAPKARRSTSEPSRPQSMQLHSRRSWILNLFSSSGNESETDDQSESSVDNAESVDDGRARRRRVVTHSTDEVSSFLDKLKLEEPRPRVGGGSMLEDVADDSGEDGEDSERASKSVAEIRQQTLEALNGTLKRGSSKPSLDAIDKPVPKPATPKSSVPHWSSGKRSSVLSLGISQDESLSSDLPDSFIDDHAIKWGARNCLGPTIKRLGAPSPSEPPSLGLGVSVSNKTPTQHRISSCPPASSPHDPQDADKCTDQGKTAELLSADMTATYASTSKWAPGFWTQQQQPTSSATWSPRGSLESEEGSGDSAGNHYSDDARYRSPRGSIALGGPPTISSRRSRRGSSPWEIVKYPETRSYPRSPTRSRPGTPPLAPEPAFFEDTAVPDSDELTVAARRSLSLRMSRNSFKQADPLPETDDPPVSAKAGRRWGSSRSQMDGNDGATDAERGRRRFHLGALESPGRPLQSSAPQGAMSPSTTSTKRRSLLRAFNSSQSNSVNLGALQQQSQAQQDDVVLQTPRPTWVVSDTSSIESSSSRDRTQLAHHQNSSRDSNTTTSTTKKSRKWWSSMLN